MPASTRASASSPPRPSTKGSPLLRRTTQNPAGPRAPAAVDGRLRDRLAPGPLADVEPAGLGRHHPHLARAQGVVEDEVGLGQPRAARMVSRSGSPGPAPTSETWPITALLGRGG
jgi:hypothetical protein